jgi:hypothetical protein
VNAGRRGTGPANNNNMTQRITDLVLSVLACAIGIALSWPFWRDFGYWGESHTLWWIYFVVGFALAVYMFNAFLDCMRTLFLHDALEKSGFLAKRDRGNAPKQDNP